MPVYFFTYYNCIIKTRASLVAVLALLSIGSLSAQELDTSGYIKTDGQLAGWVNVIHPQGGIYIYTPPQPDARLKAQAFSVGRVERQTYQLFSAQEEEVLWNLREKKNLAVSQTQELAGGSSKRRRPITIQRSLAWPKVIVRGVEVCVPVLAHSDANDWQDHLTCWSPEVNHGQ